MLWIETPTNPMMKICDIRALAEVAHKQGATPGRRQHLHEPVLPAPLALGADIVVHSTTKFLNGHSDSVGGVAIVKSEQARRSGCSTCRTRSGAILSPFDSWLTLRGTKTLALRMPRHEENACQVAPFLYNHKKVERVLLAGLPRPPRPPGPQAPGDRLRRARLVRPRQPRGGEEGARRACGSARSARAWAASRR